MMKTIFLCTLLLLACASCTKQVFEADISGRTITVLAPADNLVTSNGTITFWWEKIEEENIKYRIQIVDSSFTSIQQIIADTNVTGDKLVISLAPGKYQWRIQAWNSGTETAFQVYTITVQSSPDLSAQVVNLLSPVNGLVTNDASQVYRWDTLLNADGYRFQVLNSSSALVADYYLTTDSFPLTLADGAYTWQVRAENTFSNSTFSSRAITIDLTAPSAPVALTPADGGTSSNPVTISWSRDATAAGDSVFVSNDSLFINPAISPFYTASSSYNFTGVSGQKYYWRIRSGDAAGNWSAYSATRKFFVQ